MKDRRINKPQHVRQTLTEQVNILRANKDLDDIQRARAIAYLCNIILTAIKDGDLEERISRLEQTLKEGGTE